MQTLWTRVAQVRASCHCPQCVSSTSAVARRAAATATRRAPRFWTSSTVWYSGIFAVAATLDLGVKQQRREQWNQAIADVKQEIARSDEDANREFLDTLEERTVASAEMRDNLDSSIMRPEAPEWPASIGNDRLTSRLPPQSIYADERQKAKHMLNRWHPKKLERVQLSIDALQLEFFLEMHRHGWHEEAASAVPAWYAERILQPVEDIENAFFQKQQDLFSIFYMPGRHRPGGVDEQAVLDELAKWQRSEGDVPLCNYSQDELGQFHDKAHALNNTLRELFAMGQNRSLSKPTMLAKVYHTLSASSAPPNIDTFSILIVGLSDLGTRRLIEGCIHSLRCAMIRHNEASLASILNYWTLTGNKDEFQYWVQLMRGQWGGLSLANAFIEITPSSQGRLVKKSTLGKDKNDLKIVQRPSPTPMGFSALIKGVIKFSGFDAALNVCHAARDEGWGLCIGGLSHLLKDCSRRRDWDAGLATWKQIQALRTSRAKSFQHGTWKVPSIELPTFASMLQLCTRCNNRAAYKDVVEQAIAAHPDSAADLIRMVRAERSEVQTSRQKLESTADELGPTSDISAWLEKQNIDEHSDQLTGIPWQEMVWLDDAGLRARGVALASARAKLLEVFQQVRNTHPGYNSTEISWLPMRKERRIRQRALRAMRRRPERTEEAEGTVDASDHNSIMAEFHDHDIQEPDGSSTQQVHHVQSQASPLHEGGELNQHESYVIGMA